VLVTDVEVSTVTDTSVIITWFTGSATTLDEYGFPAPVATDSELRLAPFNTTTLALSNDLHIGEGTSGIVENGWPPTFSQDPGLPAYPVVMLDAMLGDLRCADRGADRLLVAGDLTGDGYLSEATTYVLSHPWRFLPPQRTHAPQQADVPAG
jgi:hypothetical protein